MSIARTRTHPRGKRAVATSRRLGEVLIRQGLVTEDEVGQALRRQRLTGALVGEILQERGLVTDEQVADALSESTGLRRYRTQGGLPPAEVLALLPLDVCDKSRVVPLAMDGDVLVIGQVDSDNLMRRGPLDQALCGRRIRRTIISQSEFNRIRNWKAGQPPLPYEHPRGTEAAGDKSGRGPGGRDEAVRTDKRRRPPGLLGRFRGR